MEFFKVIFKEKYTSIKQDCSADLERLGVFLYCDVGQNSQSYISWALDDKFIFGGGNSTDLEKENNFIYLSDETEDNPPRFPFKKENFIQILKDWENVLSKKPQEILITKENDKIIIQGFGKVE